MLKNDPKPYLISNCLNSINKRMPSFVCNN